jgi:uncharacterized RDD family membrane protein YckC
MDQQCPRCAAAYTAGSRFCQSCGAALTTQSQPVRTAYAPAAYSRPSGYATATAALLYPKAPLGARFWAALLDGLIGLGLCLPTFICFWIALQKSKGRSYYYDDDSYDPGGAFLLFIMGLLLYIGPLTYSFIKDGLGQGQSWGKKNMYLMVVDLGNNQPCGKGKSIARNLISTLICLVPFIGWLVEPIIVLASDSGRKLGDLAAHTQVVHIDDYFQQ